MTSREPRIYASAAAVRFSDPSESSVFGSNISTNAASRLVATEVELAGSQDVRSLWAERVGATRKLIRGIGAQPVGDANVLSIVARSTSPKAAATAANVYAESYVDARSQSIEAAVQPKIAELRKFADDAQAKQADL